MKITRTLMFLANLVRVIPVNPVMLVDATHHAVGSDVAWLVEGLRTSRS